MKARDYLVPFAVLMLIVGLRVAEPSLSEKVRFKVFDAFQRWHPRSYQSTAVCVVDLDDESLEKLGQWPWPRTQVAQLLGRLKELGAAVIALDIVFSERDRTSPAQAITAWPATPAVEMIRQLARDLPDHDRVLAQTILGQTVVTGFVLVSESNAAVPTMEAGLAYSGDSPTRFFPKFKGAVINLPEIEKAAQGHGHFNIFPEQDGVLRRVPLFLRLGDVLYPSLTAESLRVAQGVSTYLMKTSHVGVVAVKIGSLEIPTDAQGRVWLYDTGPVAERAIPAWRLFTDDFARARVEGKIVFIGSSAAGLKDIRATPLSPVTSGTEIHAQVVEQTLLGQFLTRPDWAPGAELLFLILFGLLLIFLIPRVGPLWCTLIGIAGVAGVSWGAWTLFRTKHWLLDPVFPALATLAIYLVTSLMQALRTEKERRQVRQAFSRYLSPALVNRLAEHPEQLRLGGELKNMSLLFVDIRGFTTLAEQFDAEELTQFMNRFLTPMTEVILRRGGTIDKYIGDCIMAFWNAPLDDPQHAAHACDAALEMRRALVIWNQEHGQQAHALGRRWVPVHIGIGINTGTCCVGNMGSDQRFDYSVMGDPVNLASRLESQSKAYGVDIVLGQETSETVAAYATLELDLITVKGKTKPVRVYALIGNAELKQTLSFQTLQAKHLEMLAAYRTQQWGQARRVIDDCLKLETSEMRLQTLYTLYRERIRVYEANPPDQTWDGVFIAVSK